LTAYPVHLWRLLKWGRTLARHGALTGIENDPLTPPQVRRVARIARFGARVPKTPDYAAALEEIGPPAIKLGQTLSTRPDLVGTEAADNLSKLQDNLPPAPFAAIKAEIERAFEAPLEHLYSSFDPEPIGAASIAQVHRATTTDGRDVAVKVLRPGIEDEFARAIDTYEWTAAQVESLGGEAARLRPRRVVAQFKQWTARELDLQRGGIIRRLRYARSEAGDPRDPPNLWRSQRIILDPPQRAVPGQGAAPLQKPPEMDWIRGQVRSSTPTRCRPARQGLVRLWSDRSQRRRSSSGTARVSGSA
jgi:hypothetical protein